MIFSKNIFQHVKILIMWYYIEKLMSNIQEIFNFVKRKIMYLS